MLILGIESSCDDTGVAIVEDGKRVLASCVSNQTTIHAAFGGVVPEIAAREHLSNIYPLFEEALHLAGIKAEELGAIAVTQGPGLVGALLVGISFAKGLASSLAVPLIPVDHVHAHIHGALLALPAETVVSSLFPGLALVVSGGHTHLYLMTSAISFTLLASSVDDACGECFDKVAKIMGLPYPGGPVIERLARQGRLARFPMPRMLANKKQRAFSYSGLKTHMAALIRNLPPLDEQTKADLACGFQEEAFGQIIRKVKLIAGDLPYPLQSLLVAGGVAANGRFRELLQAELGGEKGAGGERMKQGLVPSLYFPRLEYCADNGAMIAAYGWYRMLEGGASQNFAAQSWDAYSSYRYAKSEAG